MFMATSVGLSFVTILVVGQFIYDVDDSLIEALIPSYFARQFTYNLLALPQDIPMMLPQMCMHYMNFSKEDELEMEED